MKIKSKREIVLDSPIPVYDIEVPATSNFTLSSGVVVHNSKDISDGLAGALYNASLHEADFSFHLVEDADTIIETNNSTDRRDEKQGLLDNLVSTTVEKAISDMSILDNISETASNVTNNSSVTSRIKEIQEKSSDIKFSDAMKEYFEEISTNQSEENSKQSIETNPIDEARRKFLEAKARQLGRSFDPDNSKLQQLQDDKDGIVIF